MKPNGTSRMLVLLATIIVLAGSTTIARAVNITALSIDCGPGGQRILIWKEGTDGSCANTSGTIYECTEPGSDYVKADCAAQSPCQVVTIGNIAGCYSTGDAHLPPVDSLHTLETITCSNGNTFDLKGLNGDTCGPTITRHDDGTETTDGGQCTHVDSSNHVVVDSSTDCKTCGPSTWPADCTKR